MSRVRIAQHITSALLIISGLLLACSGMAEPAKAQLLVYKELSSPMAFTIAQTAIETCSADGLRVSVTVVGRNGEVLLQARGDGSNPVAFDFSFRKAYTSASLRIPSGEVLTRLKENPHWAVPTLPNVVADRGALPIKAGDQTIGAVGVAGATGEKNELCAKAGIDKIADQLK